MTHVLPSCRAGVVLVSAAFSVMTTALAQAQSAMHVLPPSVARVVSGWPTIESDSDSLLKQPVRLTYVLHQRLRRGYIEIANGAEPQRIALPELTIGTHVVEVPAGTRLADPLGPTIDCRLPPPVVGNGITVFVASLYSDRDVGAPVYNYRPGHVIRDYGDVSGGGDDAGAFRDDERGLTAYRIPGPRNQSRRTRLERVLLEVRGVGFRVGNSVLCTRGLRRPQTAVATMERVRVISTVSHEGNDRMPVLLAGTISIPRGIAAPPNALTLVGIPRR